jgi:uncharacterized protein YdeI (YjbR/CyaY-like superfamily)
VKRAPLIRPFSTATAFRRWLAVNHGRASDIWIKIHKKGSGKKTVSYAEAVDEALCFGWIDAQKKPFDTTSWLQRFCPRRPRSVWSRTNTRNVERLISTKKMTPAGLREVEAAKKDGRWARAYDSAATSKVPADFLSALAAQPKAKAFFETLNRANVYAITYRLQTARKAETRLRRMELILDMLAKGKAFH